MKQLFPAYVRMPLLFFAVFGAVEYFIDSGDRPAFVRYPMVLLFLFVVFFVLVAIEVVVTAIDTVTYRLLTDEEKKKRDEEAVFRFSGTRCYKWIVSKFSAKHDDENALLLDHDYDGIRELDNRMPPWWVNTFYITIVFSAAYLAYYHFMDGDDPEMELRKELAQARRDVEEWKKTAPDQMNEEMVTLLTDAADLAKGKEIYLANCAACHRPDAGGQIGPNLTDTHWLLGGGIKNVFHTIGNGGRDGKGMIAWKATLKPTQIQLVASYVLSLQGTEPKDAKAPDGEVWKEDAAAPTNTK